MNFFKYVYRWFESWFGTGLADYLEGKICDTDGSLIEGGHSLFVPFGVIAIVSSLLIVLLFYYVINHPRFNSLWSWLLALLMSSVINLFIGALWTLSTFSNGDIPDCLIYYEGNQDIFLTDCWMFGFANFFISAVFFIIFSIALKWRSTNCKRTPF